MSPEELVLDNLRCVFESTPTDVEAKRKQTDLLGEYVNRYLIEKDCSESKRSAAVAAIRGSYKANDSELFGHFRAASQQLEAPAKGLYPEDIRKVLLSMNARMRTPLVLAWQSGIEINRLLATPFPTDLPSPVRIDLHGRKGHRESYCTFIGRDSLAHLKFLGPKGLPEYSVLLKHLKRAARRLGERGMLKNPDIRSWHPHAFRH